jgi:hypothetical protein
LWRTEFDDALPAAWRCRALAKRRITVGALVAFFQ